MVKQVIWSSMIDYPGNISTVIFFSGCNFNCDYCYNKELEKMKTLDFNEKVLPKLILRKDFIDHIILSGGECTISSEFISIVDILYHNGFKIGIHTNGYFPEILNKIIDKIDFLGIDFKTSKKKYERITNIKNIDFERVIKTIKLGIKYNKEIQVRTTMYPVYVDLNDCIEIVQTLKQLNIYNYTIQQYYPIGTANKVSSYKDEYLQMIQEKCNKIIKTELKIK